MGINISHTSATSIVDTEFLPGTPMWDQFVEALEDLRGFPVDVLQTLRSKPGERLYLSPCRGDHADELYDLAISHTHDGNEIVRFWDAATDIPKLVRDLVDPPAAYPIPHAAPDGAYLITIQVHFKGLWTCVRINRKRNSV